MTKFAAIRPLSSRACFRSTRRRGGSVRTSCWVAANNRPFGRVDFILRTHLHPWPQTTWTCADVRSSRISRRNLESARCRVRRHSSQHQQRRGMAPQATVTVPVSPPDRVDLHVWHSARHPTPESFVSELSEHYVNRLCTVWTLLEQHTLNKCVLSSLPVIRCQ